MKNTPFLIGIVFILVAAIGGYFFMQNRSDSQMMGSDNTNMMADGEKKSMSLKELMAMGSSQMCTFSYSGEHGSTEGTSYIAESKVRTDFKGSDPTGKVYEGGMIMDGEYMYTWTTDTTQGIKMAITDTMENEMDKAQENPESYSNEYMDPNVKTDYNCSSWNVDTSKFSPPSNITFTDMSEQMQQMDHMMNESMDPMEQSQSEDKQSACSACASLTGEAATACKQALKCP